MEDQLLLFPEKIIYNDIESFDISNIPDNDFWRKNSKKFSDLPKDTYYIFKTGGINPYMKDKGPIFPYIQNVKSGKIIKVNSLTTDFHASFFVVTAGKPSCKLKRSCSPNRLTVPTPVLSTLGVPVNNTFEHK